MAVNLNSSLSKRLRRTVKKCPISFEKLMGSLEVSFDQLRNCLAENEVGGCVELDSPTPEIGLGTIVTYLDEPVKAKKKQKTPGRKSVKRCLRNHKSVNGR